MESTVIRLCEPATTLDKQWLPLYEGAFPEAEREPIERITRLMEEGKMLYHRSVDGEGNLLCFSLVSLAPDFSFLAYMATDPTRRSGGIGSKHLKQLVETLKQSYPKHIGLFFEIEATQPRTHTVPEDQLVDRRRRRSFYERAGASVLCENGLYLTPSLSDRTKEWEGELLVFPFVEKLTQRTVSFVVRQIYAQLYQLPPDNPTVAKVLRQFDQCSEACRESDQACSTETPATSGPVKQRRYPRFSVTGCIAAMWKSFLSFLRGCCR